MRMNGRWSVFSADGRAIAMCLPSSKEQAGSARQSRGIPGRGNQEQTAPSEPMFEFVGVGGDPGIFQGLRNCVNLERAAASPTSTPHSEHDD